MVDTNEVNKTLALTFPSLEFIKLISTYDYTYYETRFIIVMKRRDELGRTLVSSQRIMGYDTDTMYKECCKAARRFINKDTGTRR